jgi:hypothetical protein
MRLGRKSLATIVLLGLGLVATGQTVIVDNSDPGFSILSGSWGSGAYGSPYGVDYRWATTTSGGVPTAEAAWRPDLPLAGVYEVAVHYVSGSNRTTAAPYVVHALGGDVVVPVDQQVHDSTWVALGRFAFDAGTGGSVTLGNVAPPTVVIADAVRFRSAGGLIAHDDPRIRIGGALYARSTGVVMRLDRVDPVLLADTEDLFAPAVAVLTTGVTVRFRTDSATVQANFNHLSHVVTEGTGYVVYRDGVFDQLVSDLEVVNIASPQPGTAVTYEIVCPSYDEVTFAELELDPAATLLPLAPERRPRYFALGDSITHGAELDADTKADSTKSYPWVLATTRGWELYNLAVGGSEVAPRFGEMLTGERADMITVLWGLNDKSRQNDLPLFVSKYEVTPR